MKPRIVAVSRAVKRCLGLSCVNGSIQKLSIPRSRSLFAPNQANQMRSCRTKSTPARLEPDWKLRGALFSGKKPDGATKEALRAATTEQLRKHSRAGRSQTAFSPKTLRAAGLLSVAGVGSFLTARCGALRAAKAALATAKIPRRGAPRSFQTGSYDRIRAGFRRGREGRQKEECRMQKVWWPEA